MTTKLGELRTYYQRNWEAAFPKLPAWETVRHVAELALPFVGLLYKPAGKAISLGSTFLNVIASGVELREAKKRTYGWNNITDSTSLTTRGSFSATGWDLPEDKKLTKVHTWSLIKNGAEFIGTIANLRIGLAVHSVMDLGENSYKLFTKFKESTWSQTGERMLPIASNALYLLTLVSFSTSVAYGVIGASLVFQAGWSLYKARNAYRVTTWKDIRILDATAHAAMAVIFMTKAKTVMRQQRKILNAVQRTFVLMRPASKNNKESPTGGFFVLMGPASKHSQESPTGGLSEKGNTLAKTKMPVALNQIAKENGKNSFFFFTSRDAHHLETALLVNQQLDNKLDNTRGTFIDALAIRQILDLQPEGSYLPVIVTSGTNMKRFFEREILANPNIPEKAAHSIKEGGMRVVTMTPDEMGDLHVTQVIAVDPNKVEMPA